MTTGTTTIGVAFDNTGTVDVETGTLELAGGGTSALSALTVASGATLDFGGGTFDLTGEGSLGGTLGVSDGTLQLVASGTLIDLSALAVTGGTLDAGSMTSAWGRFAELRDAIRDRDGDGDGGGSFTVGWDAETGTGETVLEGTSSINGDVALDGGRELQNQGTLTWSGGSLYVGDSPYGTTVGGGTLDNAADATFQIESDQYIAAYSGTTLFTNEGTLTKSVTTGTTTIGVAFDNTGTVDVEAGTLDFGATVTGAGGMSVGSGATLELGGTSTNTVTFTGANATIVIESSGTTSPFLINGGGSSLPVSDIIDLPNISYDQAADSYVSNIITISNGRCRPACGWNWSGAISGH